jgi:hypothetical protein
MFHMMINKGHCKRNYFGLFLFLIFCSQRKFTRSIGTATPGTKVTSPWVQQWTARMQSSSSRSDCVAVQQKWSLL